MNRTDSWVRFSPCQPLPCQLMGTIDHRDRRHYSFFQQQGETLANLGQYQQALQSFDHGIALNPNIPALWIFRAVVLIHLKHYRDALASCDRALELAPNNSEAWIFRGAALHYLGDYQNSYSSYAQATPSERCQSSFAWINDLWQRIQSLKRVVLG
ncbi:MAG: tetratricopeptide repeat protein [Merismopedia sp. SIO2A8]|nr:tetratricopeptide repeat protein [Symploca sp. SIO2B6]NET47998.1 tetratricopeptide repeat protein [Merismopedia sp. SIO2A8]